MTPLQDPEDVQQQYATDRNLSARQGLYEEVDGARVQDVLWDALSRHAGPGSEVLEVGGGQGTLAQRMQNELGATVSFLDVSAGMVELARGRGLQAWVGDVQELPFADASFDLAVAAWMLYHVPDIDRGISELARVLRPGGSLVAVTNSVEHLGEFRRLIGYPAEHLEAFSRENGSAFLAPHFSQLERRDVDARLMIRDRQKLVAYQQSMSVPANPVPDDVPLPFVIHTRSCVFVAAR